MFTTRKSDVHVAVKFWCKETGETQWLRITGVDDLATLKERLATRGWVPVEGFPISNTTRTRERGYATHAAYLKI